MGFYFLQIGKVILVVAPAEARYDRLNRNAWQEFQISARRQAHARHRHTRSLWLPDTNVAPPAEAPVRLKLFLRVMPERLIRFRNSSPKERRADFNVSQTIAL